MQTPLQISYRNMPHSEALDANIRDRVAKFEEFFTHIVGCRVIIEASHRRHEQGNLYHAHIEVDVPGRKLVVARSPAQKQAHEDVYVAVRDAFNAMRRQLEDYARRLDGRVKTHEGPLQGLVTELLLDEDHGFVTTTDGEEIYFHRNSVTDGGFEQLRVGDAVRLSLAIDDEGEGPRATMVRKTGG